MDGIPHKFNSIEPSTSWKWDIVKDSDTGENPIVFYLTAGEHTLEIVRRENGAKLDKVYITNQTFITPEGCLDQLSTDVNDFFYKEGNSGQIVVKNPVVDCLELNPDLSFPAILKIYDIKGCQLESMDLDEVCKI